MKKLLAALLCAMLLVTAACAEEAANPYAIPEVKLCGTDTNNASFMKGFSMQGTIGDLVNDDAIFSVAMCYTTAEKADVEAYFAAEPFNEPSGFLAEIDALDVEGKIRNLSDSKKSYLDGNVDDPIRFYGDGVDLIAGTSLLQTAGTYHFYLVTVGYEKVLAVAEADKTFTIDQAAIDLSNDFADAFYDIGTEVELPYAETQEAKTAAVLAFVTPLAKAYGTTADVAYCNDASYPDDYEVTLSKNGSSSSDYLTVTFAQK